MSVSLSARMATAARVVTRSYKRARFPSCSGSRFHHVHRTELCRFLPLRHRLRLCRRASLLPPFLALLLRLSSLCTALVSSCSALLSSALLSSLVCSALVSLLLCSRLASVLLAHRARLQHLAQSQWNLRLTLRRYSTRLGAVQRASNSACRSTRAGAVFEHQYVLLLLGPGPLVTEPVANEPHDPSTQTALLIFCSVLLIVLRKSSQYTAFRRRRLRQDSCFHRVTVILVGVCAGRYGVQCYPLSRRTVRLGAQSETETQAPRSL